MTDSPFPNDDLQALAAGYVLGDLSSEEMVQFQELLATHPELAQTVASLQATLAMLPQGLPSQQPDSRVRSHLLATATSQLNDSPAPAFQSLSAKSSSTQLSGNPSPRARFFPIKSPQARPQRLSWATSLAAAVAIALGGCSLWLTHRVVTLQTRLSAAEHFAEMAITDRTVSNATLTVSPADSLLSQEWSGLLQLMQDHLKSVGRSQGPVDVATTDPDTLSAQFALSGQIPTLDLPQIKLLGGSRCQFGQAQGVRLTYQLPEAQTISVYKIDLNGNQFPEFLETHVTLRSHTVNLILWREQDYLYALTAALPIADLQTLAQSMETL